MMSHFLHYLTLRDEKYKYLLAILAFFSALFTSWAWYPGFIGDDVMTQYLQATGIAPLTDAHPPIFAWFWWLEMKIFGTANLLDATWIFLSALGLYLFLKLKPCILSLIVFFALFYSPLFFALSGFAWKDIIMSWLLLISSALLFGLDREIKHKKDFYMRMLITFLLVLSCLLRTNGSFIAIPLVVATWWGWFFDLKRLVICLFFVIVSLPVTSWINHKIFRATNDHMEVSLGIFDIAGISFYNTHKTYDDIVERSLETYRPLFVRWEDASQEEKLSACYDPKLWDSLGSWTLAGYPYLRLGGWNKWHQVWINGDTSKGGREIEYFCSRFGRNFRYNLVQDGSHRWISSIVHNPVSYIKHRLGHFTRNYLTPFNYDSGLLAWGLGFWDYGAMSGYFPAGVNDKVYVSSHRQTWMTRKYLEFGNAHTHLWTHYGLFWFASALALFVMTFRQTKKADALINLLTFSALCYFLGYIFVSVANEWRYIMPSVVLIIASFLVWYVYGGNLGTSYLRKLGGSVWIFLILLGLVL